MTQATPLRGPKTQSTEPDLEVLIEIPRGSFLKRGSTGHVDFVSPLPCPFNYGSAPQYIGLEGDLLDAVVLGPRLPRGTRLIAKARGAVAMVDRGMMDYKVICSDQPVTAAQRRALLRFFHLYAKCKGLLNLWRHRPGRNACDGWLGAREVISNAMPRDGSWRGPPIPF
jgi:inorganic pyrophosphatase